MTIDAFHVPAVIVPMLESDESVVTAVFTRVPEVGRVTLVLPVAVNVCGLERVLHRKYPSDVHRWGLR